MNVNTIKLDIGQEACKLYKLDVSAIESMRVHSRLFLEFAEGLFNMGKLDFNVIRISKEYSGYKPSKDQKVNIRISDRISPTIKEMYETLPRVEKKNLFALMMLKTISIYEGMSADQKLLVMRCSIKSESIVLTDVDAAVRLNDESKPIDIEHELKELEDQEVETIVDVEEGSTEFSRLFEDAIGGEDEMELDMDMDLNIVSDNELNRM